MGKRIFISHSAHRDPSARCDRSQDPSHWKLWNSARPLHASARRRLASRYQSLVRRVRRGDPSGYARLHRSRLLQIRVEHPFLSQIHAAEFSHSPGLLWS